MDEGSEQIEGLGDDPQEPTADLANRKLPRDEIKPESTEPRWKRIATAAKKPVLVVGGFAIGVGVTVFATRKSFEREKEWAKDDAFREGHREGFLNGLLAMLNDEDSDDDDWDDDDCPYCADMTIQYCPECHRVDPDA